MVGKVLSAADKHPDADRLTVCQVDDGSGEARTIVCGAPNVAAGQTVAVALPGATMPDGTDAGRGRAARGQVQRDDPGGGRGRHRGPARGDHGAGRTDRRPGRRWREALPIADEVLELEITPNRPGLPVGLRRRARAARRHRRRAGGRPHGRGHGRAAATDTAEDHASVEIADPDVCLRFTARVFEDVTVGPSPEWLKQRLTAAGQRPISNVVDITNYVMLATGQPLHAFDLDKVRGGGSSCDRAPRGRRWSRSTARSASSTPRWRLCATPRARRESPA